MVFLNNQLLELSYLEMINDFHQVLYKTNTILYADDTVSCCAANISKDIQKFWNHDPKNVETWFDRNNLVIKLKQG